MIELKLAAVTGLTAVAFFAGYGLKPDQPTVKLGGTQISHLHCQEDEAIYLTARGVTCSPVDDLSQR